VELDRRIASADASLQFVAAGTSKRGYVLTDVIGEGTFGTVYRAVHPSVGREVAVKVVRAEFADDPDYVRRFDGEARLVARLEHPHIVPLHDFWREPGRRTWYFAISVAAASTRRTVVRNVGRWGRSAVSWRRSAQHSLRLTMPVLFMAT
jgi:serine/threonine protein kinase